VVAGDALRRVPDALDELVALVESARAVPLSASCVLPREHVLDLLDELRGALPRALADAREVLFAREELLGQARDRRDRVTADARAEADRRVSAEGVRRAAEAEARGVIEAARERADRMCADADAYADERLAALEDTLARLLGTVERGREVLRRDADDRDSAALELAPAGRPAGR
jgi:cell division septum initiation protein DivIVA